MNREKIHEIIINNLPHGFSLVDKEGVIIEFNRAAEELTGYTKSDVIGRSHLEIFHGTSDKSKCPLMQFILGEEKRFDSLESLLKKKNGETIMIAVTVFPIYDMDGLFMGGVELFRDITAQKKREREHKNILSMFAHDMKNPIVIARGFLTRLLSEKAGDINEKQREYFGLIEEELKRLHELISDFLQFSRFEAKEYNPVLSPFNITAALLEHVKSAKVEADMKNLKIVCDIPGSDHTPLMADGSMISRVISNLLDNAIKYTNPGGTITIAIADRNKDLLVSIKDTGIGISKEHLPYIFDAFYRVSKDSKGSGLGLFIAKTIVEAHGGTIWVESVPSEGSTFFFTLPKESHKMALLS
jgi:two-component system, OmpR family, phosphate regulon sensor histidine kinase PhoR